MLVCPHGNIAETCRSCYPDSDVPEVKASAVAVAQPAEIVHTCVHGARTADCKKCGPESSMGQIPHVP